MGHDERRRHAAEIERLAREVWGDEVGQVIVGHQIAVFHIRGSSLLLHIDHDKRSVEAAFAALRAMMPEKPPVEPPAVTQPSAEGDAGAGPGTP